MKDKNTIDRRAFLKVGGMLALSAPAARVISTMGDQEIVESEGAYGGFAVRRHAKDDPPYQVDDEIYQRYDFRKGLNPLVMGAVGATMLERTRNREPGFTRLGLAFQEGAWTVANAFGSDSLYGDGGLYSWSMLENTGTHGAPDFPAELGTWDYEAEGVTREEVSRAVKKAAKFYGASLAGIAEVDQRWFYRKSIYMDMSELLSGAGEMAEEQGLEMPEIGKASGREVVMQAMLSMEAKDTKALLVRTVKMADPEILPEGMNPTAAKAIPVLMIHRMLPTVMPTMSREYVHLLASEIDPALLPEDFDPDQILEEDETAVEISESMPAGEIRFEDVEAPYHDRENKVQVIPTSMKYVIVMAFEMDPVGLSLEHGLESGGSVSHGYSRMAFTSASLAQFIRYLGYQAVPLGNDTGLSVPMAVDAGLGELSRIGILVTPKYGPRIRLAKVVTDMPLAADQPISFGVTEFCEVCGKCAESCPSGAITAGERGYDTPPTGNPGVYKWAADGAKCINYWAESGTGCSQCIVSCPFNKVEGWLHEATRILIGAKSGPLDKLLLKLDDASGYGTPKPSREFWDQDTCMHIKES